MPRAAPRKGPKKGKAPKAHRLAEKFPQGTVLRDSWKKEWNLGPIIGQGGFGLIYLASNNSGSQVSDKTSSHVVKIEPIANGPLFCEMQFYMRAAQKQQIDGFISSHKLKYLPVPPLVGSGTHTFNEQTYRLVIIPRFGTDLQKLLVASDGTFPEHSVFAVGLRMIDALQYLHENEYVHADIKASNIMLGFRAGKDISNEVYLCDYGLAYRYTVNGEHKEYKEDPKKAHEGTIDFTSRDAHKGLFPSRRGDLEILGYCMLRWLCGKLPWEDRLNDPSYVATKKNQCMDNLNSLIKDCFQGGKSTASDTMLKYMDVVKHLDYDEEPNYNRIRTLLKSGLNKSGQKDEWKIDLATKPKAQKRRSTDPASPVKSPKQRRTASPKKAARQTPKVSKCPVAITKGKKSPAKPKSKGKPISPVKKAVSSINGVHKKTMEKSKAVPKPNVHLPPPSKSPRSKAPQIPPPSKSPRSKTPQIPPPSKSPRSKTPQIPPPSKSSKSRVSPRSKIRQIPPPTKFSP